MKITFFHGADSRSPTYPTYQNMVACRNFISYLSSIDIRHRSAESGRLLNTIATRDVGVATYVVVNTQDSLHFCAVMSIRPGTFFLCRVLHSKEDKMVYRLSVLSSVSTILIFLLLVSQSQESLSQVNNPDEENRRYWEEVERKHREKEKAEYEAAMERRRKAIEQIKPRMVEIPSEIANIPVIIRSGIDDLGMNVQQVIESLYLSPHLNKDKLCYWESDWFAPSNRYNLACQFKGRIRVIFILSKDKSIALLRFHSIDRDRPLPADYMVRLLL